MTVAVVAQFVITMGKKNRKAKSAAAETESGMPRYVRREVLEIASQLLESRVLSYVLHYSVV